MAGADRQLLQCQIAEQLRYTISNNNIEQYKLAEILSVSKAYISQILSPNKKIPSPDFLGSLVSIIETEFGDTKLKYKISKILKEYGDESYQVRYLVSLLESQLGNTNILVDYIENKLTLK